MNILSDGDVEIDGYVIGPGREIFVLDFDTNGPGLRTQDGENPVGESRMFGRDYLTPGTFALEVATNGSTAADALDALARLQSVVRNQDVRLQPGETVILRYSLAGRTRRVYGRARIFKRKSGPVNDGVVEAVGTFDPADCLFYDDTERAVQVRMVPDPTGGFTLPTTVPLIMGKIADVQGTIADVGGTEPTPFRAVITGPVNKPGVAGNGWEVKLTGNVVEGDTVTIDTRTGEVTDAAGNSRAGELTRYSWLEDARLQPGPDHVIFSGQDPTGTSTATIYWHPAYGEI